MDDRNNDRLDDQLYSGGMSSSGADRMASTSMASTSQNAESDDPDAIRADIRETRDRVGDTLEQIGERLNPHHITEQVKDNLRDATIGRVEHMAENAAERVNETRTSIMERVRDNPIPAAMVGIGLGWLFMNGRKQNSSSSTQYSGSKSQSRNQGYGSGSYQGSGSGYGRNVYGSSYQGGYSGDTGEGTVDHLRDRAGELGQTVKDTAGNLADKAQGVAGTIADRTQNVASSLVDHTQDMASSIAQTSRNQTRRVEDLFQEAPLVAGVATLALGLAAGLALPSTRKESELMGDARDHFVDHAREVVNETTTKVGHVAERVVDQAQSTAAEAAKSEGLTA